MDLQEQAPLFSSALLGFRCWQVDDLGALYPMTAVLPEEHIGIPGEFAWEPGVNHALCHKRLSGISEHTEPVPAGSCTCGFYARHHLEDLKEITRETIVGAIAGKGQVRLHAGGFRAQEAQILGIIRNPYLVGSEDLNQLARERYHLPMFSTADKLITHARQLAAPVPESIRLQLEEEFLNSMLPAWVPGSPVKINMGHQLILPDDGEA